MRVIRPMTEADAPFAAEVEKKCFSQPWSEKSFVDAVRDRNTLYIIAEEDGVFAGMCGLWQSFEEADVMNVAVDPDFRGRKIAADMLAELIRLGGERGITAFTLEVRVSNAVAISLYEKFGFEAVGVRKNYYEFPREDALIMWKR